MHNVVRIVRILLGLPFVVFGAMYFGGWFDPLEQDHSPDAMRFWETMVATGYMMPLLKGTELAAGVLLMVGQFVPFALVILAPVTVNIVAYHVYLDPNPGAMAMGIAIAALHVFLFAAYGQAYEGVMRRVRVEKKRM